MARKQQQKIKVISYVLSENGECIERWPEQFRKKVRRVDALAPEEKKKLGEWIATTWLNEIYKGVAVFSVPEETDSAGAS